MLRHGTAPISYGKTRTRSLTGEEGRLSYPANAKVTIYSKGQRGADGVELLEAEVYFDSTTELFHCILYVPNRYWDERVCFPKRMSLRFQHYVYQHIL